MSKLRLVVDRAARHDDPSAGRVVHDSRGNAVWDWAIATGVLAKATTDELLQALVRPMPVTPELEQSTPTRWAGDPYNRNTGRRRF